MLGLAFGFYPLSFSFVYATARNNDMDMGVIVQFSAVRVQYGHHAYFCAEVYRVKKALPNRKLRRVSFLGKSTPHQ